MDEDYARALARQLGEEDEDTPRPPMSPLGYTAEVELLTGIFDAIRGLEGTLIAVNSQGGKRPFIDPLPRPEPALKRIRREAELGELRDIAAIWINNN